MSRTTTKAKAGIKAERTSDRMNQGFGRRGRWREESKEEAEAFERKLSKIANPLLRKRLRASRKRMLKRKPLLQRKIVTKYAENLNFGAMFDPIALRAARRKSA